MGAAGTKLAPEWVSIRRRAMKALFGSYVLYFQRTRDHRQQWNWISLGHNGRMERWPWNLEIDSRFVGYMRRKIIKVAVEKIRIRNGTSHDRIRSIVVAVSTSIRIGMLFSLTMCALHNVIYVFSSWRVHCQNKTKGMYINVAGNKICPRGKKLIWKLAMNFFRGKLTQV